MTILTALFAATAMQAASAQPDLSWMAGYWLDCSPGREASETWTDPRGGIMIGAAVTVASGETSFEYARVAPIDGVMAYVAQPGGVAATAFPVIEASATRVVFQNLDNDFPQRVIYQRTGDVLTARIEGRTGDRDQAMDWRFNKAELNTRCPTP